MIFPRLQVPSASRQMIDVFGGYNHNLRIGDGEFYDMQNMTSDHYPVLASRNHRSVIATAFSGVKGMIAKEHLCILREKEDQSIVLQLGTDQNPKSITINDGLTDGEKRLVSMGAYVIILPDGKWINTIPTKDSDNENVYVYEQGTIDAEITTTDGVSFEMCKANGESIGDTAVQDTAPADPVNGTLWIDTSDTPHRLRQYSETEGAWTEIATSYVKIKATGIGSLFAQYDGVTISGITAEGAEALNGSHTLQACAEDYIVVVGILGSVTEQNEAVTVSRRMPEMDFVVESGNRLWGCKYGNNADGKFVNEIYASKLGDFKNWNCLMEISTDSWTLSCGSDGPFTGAIAHSGCPLFFKENGFHKVYGTAPSNFQAQYIPCRGVQEGSHRSLAIVGDVLFYKAIGGVCAYDGSLPTEVSQALGNVQYTDAVAGASGNKYYISMKDSEGTYTLFVYDTAKRLWHKEDHIQWSYICAHKNELYAIEAPSSALFSLTQEGINEAFEWFAESGIIGMQLPNMKYISRLLIRISLEDPDIYRTKRDGYATVSVKYDSGEWEDVTTVTRTGLRTFVIPIRLKRCDHFRIKIRGMGRCKIYSITKTIEQGSDVS